MSTWYIYQVSKLSLQKWRKYGVSHERVTESRDITAMARALNLAVQCMPDIDWYEEYHEYWLTECPGAPPIVTLRRNSNPFDGALLVSPIPLPHLEVDAAWTRELSSPVMVAA